MEKFKNYILIDEIGRGGMAEVFQAVQMGVLGVERVVALKRMISQISAGDKMVKLFMREGKLALQLQHPNIVATYDFGMDNEVYYLAMEFIEGWDLRGLMKAVYGSGETFPLSVSVYIIQSILKGLDFAHNLKDVTGDPLHIVHRDISPGNVMITTSGVVKISDFGVARATVGEEYTIGGAIAGKFSYLSPEMVSGLPIDLRSDIFAVGVIFIELLTGEKLFSGEEFEIMRKIREGYAEDFVKKMNFPDLLKEILLKFIVTDLSKRYRTDKEAISDLNNFVFKHLFQNIEDEFRQFISCYQPQIKLKAFNKDEIEVFWDDKTTPVSGNGLPVKRLSILLLIGVVFAGFYFYVPGKFFKERENGHQKETVISSKDKEVAKPVAVLPSHSKKKNKKFVTKKKRREQISSKRKKIVKSLRIDKTEKKSEVRSGDLRVQSEEKKNAKEKTGKKQENVVSTAASLSVANSKSNIKSSSDSNAAGNRKHADIKKNAEPGFFTILTTPWAQIYIDNKDYGNTPLFKLKLSSGKHTVHLYSPQTGVERKFEIEIKSGKTFVNKISMEAGK